MTLKTIIQNFIKEFITNYKGMDKTVTKWDEPLIAFADANDPLFSKLKSIVSETHFKPNDLLEDAHTVISYFIPFRKEIAISNVDGNNCSREWAIAYIETNQLIINLNEALSEKLKRLSYESANLPPTHNFDEKKLISKWSYKHIAFIAGLGKFGLHQMLITEKGCCGRLGSLITNAKIEPSKRPQGEFCLYLHNETCKECVEKCSFGALKTDSFNRRRCYEICLLNNEFHSDLKELTDVCGKCICVVPCSFTNPL